MDRTGSARASRQRSLHGDRRVPTRAMLPAERAPTVDPQPKPAAPSRPVRPSSYERPATHAGHRPTLAGDSPHERGEALDGRGGDSFPREYVHKYGSGDRKSTRLNSSHSQISYAVFCLQKKMTDRGGPPFTMALNPSSPAIHFGGSLCPPRTQPTGHPRPHAARSSLVAFEIGTPAPPDS